jgi:hypothetical protein
MSPLLFFSHPCRFERFLRIGLSVAATRRVDRFGEATRLPVKGNGPRSTPSLPRFALVMLAYQKAVGAFRFSD